MYTNVQTRLHGKSSTNNKLQISKIKQLPILRQGVWNADISEYVYSTNNVSIRLSHKAIGQLSKVYDGTPMRVIFTEKINVCSRCCQSCASCCSSACMTCVHCINCLFPCLHLGYCMCGIFLLNHVKQSALNYFRDDYVVAHEIWFGYKNMPAENATCFCCCENDCGFDNIVNDSNKELCVSLCAHTEKISHKDATVVVTMANTSVDYVGDVSAYDGRGSTASRTFSQRGNLDYLVELERESWTSSVNNGVDFGTTPSEDGVTMASSLRSEEQQQRRAITSGGERDALVSPLIDR